MAQQDPAGQLAGMINGYKVAQAIYVAARLEVADALAREPQTAEQLAEGNGAHAESLYRLLRALASVGVFSEGDEGRFSNTPMSELLRPGVPDSKWAWAMMMGEEHFACYGDLLGTVETGQPAFDRIYGKPIFEYLSHNPRSAAIFDKAMVSVHGRETEALAKAYDFSKFGTLADIGGGNGSLLVGLLQQHAEVRGILFDLPHVVERARENLAKHGLDDRVERVAGNFFEEISVTADAFLMRHIIHDWNDERCQTILRNLHQAMPDNAKLLVVESVIPPGNEPGFGKLLDLTMMLIPGGKERTEREFRELFDTGGFELTQIVPTGSEVSIIEGRKR